MHIWGPASARRSTCARGSPATSRRRSSPSICATCRAAHAARRARRRRSTVGEFRVSRGAGLPSRARRSATASRAATASLAYLPDHEPALGRRELSARAGLDVGLRRSPPASTCSSTTRSTAARSTRTHVGWGHSTIEHALAFAALARVKQLVPFHHDPAHDDDDVECLTVAATRSAAPEFPVTAGAEGASLPTRLDPGVRHRARRAHRPLRPRPRSLRPDGALPRAVEPRRAARRAAGGAARPRHQRFEERRAHARGAAHRRADPSGAARAAHGRAVVGATGEKRQLVAASLRAGDVEVARALALRIRRRELPLPADLPAEPSPPPIPRANVQPAALG